MSNNVGMALMVVGLVWIAVHYHVYEWWMIVLVIIGLSTFEYQGFSDERKALIKAQIKYLESKADYFRNRKEELLK